MRGEYECQSSHNSNLVEYEIFPFLSPKRLVVLNDELVRGNTNMECIRLGPAVSLLPTFLQRSVISEDLESGAPFLDLHLPVQHDAGRYYDEMRTPNHVFAG